MLNRKTFTKISLRFSIPFEKRSNQGLQQFNEEASIEGEDFLVTEAGTKRKTRDPEEDSDCRDIGKDSIEIGDMRIYL